MELKYGKDYPNMCPPEQAKAYVGSFYRLCESTDPSESDFITHYELGNIPRGQECEARALSFFDDLGAIENLKQKFKKKFGNKVAVLVDITSKHGIGILENHHLNLWEYKDVSFLETTKNQEGGSDNGKDAI